MAATGFFPPAASAQAPPPSVARCGQCKLYTGCKSPKLPVGGLGRRGVLIVGAAPEAQDDALGGHWRGPGAQRLRGELSPLGWDLDRDGWLYNALICHPGPDGPAADQVEHCRPNLLGLIKKLQPTVVLLMGEAAVNALIKPCWRDSPGGLLRWTGWRIPDQTINAWVCPTWDPAEIAAKEQRNPALLLWWRRHLKAALAIEAPPWPDGPPDYLSRVELVYDPAEAAARIDAMVAAGLPVAFDYETNMLKPDSPRAEIVSCSLSDGESTFAYPWHGAAIEATRRFLWSPVPKYGWNLQYENRWSQRFFGRGVRNWAFDGMHGSHVLDNRNSVTGLKFQSYVRLGQPRYDLDVKPYLEADGNNECNRIKEADLRRILKYNGADSLLTHVICEQQRKELGI